MSTTILFRAAAVLLVLFALGHQIGFRTVDPQWGAAEVVRAMQTTHFTVQGAAGRTYWGFFSGFGFFVTGFLLFSAVLAWELGGVPGEMLRQLSRVLWAFALCYAVIAILTWTYFFVAPGVFATLVAACIALAAWQATRTPSATRHYLSATQRFYGSISNVEVRDVLVDGDRACVLTHYTLRPPNGAAPFESDVAEIFSVRHRAIQSLGIYFDSAPFPK